MSFEVDRYSSAWAHIALCADLTWATEPPDEFNIANQRLWAQHCRVSQVLQEPAIESQILNTSNQCELAEKRLNLSQIQENGSISGRRSVKDVIPESRLAHYGNFYYDEAREKYYTNVNEKTNGREYSGQGCENSDLTECWMLPEVEYWFRKLVDEPADRSSIPRRRRQYRITDDDFERWGLAGTRAASEEAALAARVMSVRGLWAAPQPLRTPSPPPAPRKMRARRRQPRRLAALAPPPPAYCLDAPTQLFCDPSCKFQFESPRPPQLTECQRAMGRLSASVQAVMRATAARCQPYRGTNVTRYAPTCQRPARGVWWPRDHRFHLANVPQIPAPETFKTTPTVEIVEVKQEEDAANESVIEQTVAKEPSSAEPQPAQKPPVERSENPKPKERIAADGQQPSTSAAAVCAAAVAADCSLRKRRLYSAVLSMSAPAPLALGCVRLAHKLVPPGLIKLTPKVLAAAGRARLRQPDSKFEQLEQEALEQYKASDESIDTKFRELEAEAVEQYSNTNTSCSSGEKRAAPAPAPAASPPDADPDKSPPKFHKDEAVDGVVIYSHNFPDLNAKSHPTSVTDLKNFHTPPRGEKKEQTHRPNKSQRSLKSEGGRAASDTDSARTRGRIIGAPRGTLHVGAPKKRHLALAASDCSSDEEVATRGGRLRDAAAPRAKQRGRKQTGAAHGAGDLHPPPLRTNT